MTTSAPDRERSTASFEYRMPSLGADMDVGRVVSWSVAVGDEVHRGDVMAVVETEKSDIDIEIWHDGVVEEFLVEIGEEVDVGTPIAVMRHLGEAGEAPAPPEPAADAEVSEHEVPADPRGHRAAGLAVVAVRTGAPLRFGHRFPAPTELEHVTALGRDHQPSPTSIMPAAGSTRQPEPGDRRARNRPGASRSGAAA